MSGICDTCMYADGDGAGFPVEPDGFCAWAESRHER